MGCSRRWMDSAAAGSGRRGGGGEAPRPEGEAGSGRRGGGGGAARRPPASCRLELLPSHRLDIHRLDFTSPPTPLLPLQVSCLPRRRRHERGGEETKKMTTMRRWGEEVVSLSLRGHGYGDEDDDRPEKPRRYGVTEMRSPIYSFRPTHDALQVRHAQGMHNVEGEKDHSAYMSPALFDAHLSPLGWNQVDCLREHVKKCGLAKKIELVITSPLLRTMQTAVGVFGGENYTDGIGAPPLMVENAGHSGRLAISSFNCPPFLAVEACRERLGVNPCDKRRSITEYRALFPAIDFSLIENDEDVLWEPGVREADEPVAARGMKFIDWLWTREEKEIAIVTHSAFLDQTLIMYSRECHPTIRQELGKRFDNCELRSMVLVDRSMLGSDAPGPGCNYPGKIPAGLDLPSDVADKHLEEARKN